jgi:hypothetical protein
VVGRLDEPDPNHAAPALALQHRFHQRRSDPCVLKLRSDGHRADPGDHPALVDECAPDELAGALRDQAGEAVAGQHLANLEARELV